MNNNYIPSHYITTDPSTEEAEVNGSKDQDRHKFKTSPVYIVSSRPLGSCDEPTSVGEGTY